MVATSDSYAPRLRLAPPPSSRTRRRAQLPVVEARRLDHTLPAHRSPHVSSSGSRLHLNGLSITTDLPLARGESLSLTVCREPNFRWHARGRVTDCQPVGHGYRIAITYDLLPAA